LQQQLLLQPQLCSQQQFCSQQQLCSQQQPQLLRWNTPQMRSRIPQPPPQQQELQQLSQPQLCSQQQDCSQQQLFSQQLQLGSQQQPQPEPSIRSNKQKPKLGLVRAMLNMIAPKNLFIGHRLLCVGTSRCSGLADFRQRAMPPHAVCVGRV
jgi:hypothetical protein